ncbi:glycine-rich protein [Clostridioides difficile]|uniref:glycine-rich protein n=1 Tax=Clostridioides difficile TaxID=1496 RepID=UPI00097FE4F7|nr:glycine-rich protein [Clostridioides difficile]EKS6818732.1 hypothetical protein [Clostridioides difficile]SJO87023.1 Glycine rich protein [Clostridioides difficile]HBF4255799.1 hypothetical protein [Clostridioides difficile]HBF4444281.1 hypothetical protein [Clostridioides difficile]HDO9121656.1 hypothetical protein [Clostridioides difficile]
MATVYEFNYTKNEQRVTLSPGKYKLECWGAGGGAYSSSRTKPGGYSKGEITLKKETILYVYVGQSGYNVSTSGNGRYHTFNGGGLGSFVNYKDTVGIKTYLGGGATDIRLIGGTWDNEQGLLSRIIVAGGGGSNGFNDDTIGGGGGGTTGLSATIPIDNSTNLTLHGGSQTSGGISQQEEEFSGSFGKGGCRQTSSLYSGSGGGGGGWFGGLAYATKYPSNNYLDVLSGSGGSGYVLTKDSYKPAGYIPTKEFWMENTTTYSNQGIGSDGRARITLLEGLPSFELKSYSSTQAVFIASHTEENKLTKIEWFIDNILKGTITDNLYLEKTINYTLTDNAIHTLKIVVTDYYNKTIEKVISVSKSIMPLEDDASLQDIASKVGEMKEGLINGKTSIINVLALKNIESSLNNSLVELSEKIKQSFDSSDASVQDLKNQLTEKNNNITQLNNTITNQNGTINNLRDQLNKSTIHKVEYNYGDTKGTPHYYNYSGVFDNYNSKGDIVESKNIHTWIKTDIPSSCTKFFGYTYFDNYPKTRRAVFSYDSSNKTLTLVDLKYGYQYAIVINEKATINNFPITNYSTPDYSNMYSMIHTVIYYTL